jgi:hypothetical protein
MMRRRFLIASAVWFGLAAAFGWHGGTCRADDRRKGRPDESPPPARETLQMSEAVVCRSIDGYEDYEPLPDAAQTSDEKLLVYYRPFGYKTAFIKDSYQAHLTQDAEIRRRGGKAVLRQKKKLLDYTAKSPQPPELIYLRNTISLKELKPGEYDLAIILHDEIGQGPPATQVVKFRVIPAQDPKNEAAGGGTTERTSSRMTRPGKNSRGARRVSPGRRTDEGVPLERLFLEWELGLAAEEIE